MLPKWFPSKIFPNEGNYVAAQIDAISRLKPTVVLYVHSDSSQPTKGNYFEVSNELNSTVYRAYFRKYESRFIIVNRMINFYRYFKAQNDTYQLIVSKKGIPILIHVHVLLRTSFFAVYLKITQGIPFVISEHWSIFLTERQDTTIPTLKKVLIRFMCSKAKVITCVSEALKIGLEKISRRQDIHVIYNGIDTGLFNINRGVGNENAIVKMLHISRLDSYPKNIPGILSAIESLYKKRQDFEIHIIGDGIERESQIELSRKLGLYQKVVFFHGYLSPKEVSSWMNESDFLIVFSDYESQSKVILESFSCGIPVIATKVGGIPEMINTNRGILIAPRDEKVLVCAMEEMLDFKLQNFEPTELRSYAVSVSSYEVIGRKFIDAYGIF